MILGFTLRRTIVSFRNKPKCQGLRQANFLLPRTERLHSSETKLISNLSKSRLLLQHHTTMPDKDIQDYEVKEELPQRERSRREMSIREAHRETLEVIHEISTLLVRFA